ncbi:MAG: hypothetical protein M3N41_01015 [Acidobacteriota bacterium]|nr:hypothetical protein [Acidobacteriota bacterium]
MALNLKLGIALVLAVVATAQDVKLNVTYVCNGERMYVENCNIRDLSDTATCMVGHPDRPTRNGIMAYTNETRGALKALLPTCKQPSPQELAAADAFKKKQQEIYDANVAKANPQPPPQANAPARLQSQGGQPPAPPKNAEERAIRRCVSSGRLPATCTGNSLLGAFGQMVAQVLPSAAKESAPGPEIAGAYEGAGKWRIDFIDQGVLVNCSVLAPDQHAYTLDFKNNRATITIDTTPKPLVLTLNADGTIVGQGPVVLDGVIVAGYDSGMRDANGNVVENPAFAIGPVYDEYGRRITRSSNTGHANFAPKRVTCPALNLSTKGAGTGIQTMQTDLLKSMFNDGDKGPPTPPGIRMHGIFAASTGFSAQFFPESVILGCGPDAARAYPYTVVADGTKSGIKIDAPDHPLNLAFGPNGSLDPGPGPYQVHGRIVIGTNDNDDFTFAPLEQTCNLAVLSPSKTIPSAGGVSSSVPGTLAPANAGGGLSTPAAPLGNAVLSIVSGFPAQPGVPNPLAGRPYVLLRNTYTNALAKGGVTVPPGMSPYKFVGTTCVTRTPDCQKIMNAMNGDAASAVRADANGAGTFPGVPAGTYYLMISARVNNQALSWSQAVQLKAGTNSVTLDRNNAVPID